MTDITVIGLGSMGAALGRALLAGKHAVTVWNRSPARMDPLIVLGAVGATSLGAAIAASPLIVVCIDNYAVSQELLGHENLSGKVLIQLSTGTPREAREASLWAHERGTAYLDGAIMEYPSAIGSENALILMSGPREAYDRAEPCLKSLAGRMRYLGDNIAGAAALDMALLTKTLGLMVGTIHAAHICEAENIDVDLFASVLPASEDSRFFAELVARDAFADPGATMNTWYGAVQRIEQQARDAEINDELPAFLASLFKRGVAAGYGDEDMTALIKVLRKAEPRE
jgi:3-hydroxyisobutyrate dehydrogenase-like beta-hydroxyacid dehydrogenase